MNSDEFDFLRARLAATVYRAEQQRESPGQLTLTLQARFRILYPRLGCIEPYVAERADHNDGAVLWRWVRRDDEALARENLVLTDNGFLALRPPQIDEADPFPPEVSTTRRVSRAALVAVCHELLEANKKPGSDDPVIRLMDMFGITGDELRELGADDYACKWADAFREREITMGDFVAHDAPAAQRERMSELKLHLIDELEKFDRNDFVD